MDSYKIYLEDQHLNPRTISNHIRNVSAYDGDLEATETNVIKYIKTNYAEGSQQKTILGAISKYRGYKELPVDKIHGFMHSVQKQTIGMQQDKTKEIELPNIKDLTTKMRGYLKDGSFRDYVVMFLLINFQTRNLDLVARVTHDVEDVDKSSNWLLIRENDVVYYRSNYKTADSYGIKRHVTRSKPFHHAVSQLTHILTPTDNLYRTVMTITGGYNETTLMKMSVVNNNSIKGLTKLSNNRGTALSTISSSYDAT
mgnify:FL=1